MEIKRLDGHLWKRFVESGSREVINRRNYINAINVFPVADGDTGTNLSKTLEAMAEKSVSTDSFSDTVNQVTRSGLAHARGNSGIIFVSYFNGLAIGAAAHDSISISEFAHIAHHAVPYAYQSVENPVEGTMITVIRDWAQFLYEHYMHFDSFNSLLHEAYLIAERSLEKTTEFLEVFKKNRVVDAGALGFVAFLSGINIFLKNPNADHLVDSTVVPKLLETGEEESHFRFCTEAFLDRVVVPQEDLKAKLQDLGDSLIVTQVDHKMRVHIHTDHPQALFQLLKSCGELKEQKVEDMWLQQAVRKEPLSTIALLTDSIADIADDLKLKYQIHTLPLRITVDEVDYLDKASIQLESVFKSMLYSEYYPSSSLPAPADIEEKLRDLLDRYEQVLIVLVSSQLSGTYNAVLKASERLDPSGQRIKVIDT